MPCLVMRLLLVSCLPLLALAPPPPPPFRQDSTGHHGSSATACPPGWDVFGANCQVEVLVPPTTVCITGKYIESIDTCSIPSEKPAALMCPRNCELVGKDGKQNIICICRDPSTTEAKVCPLGYTFDATTCRLRSDLRFPSVDRTTNTDYRNNSDYSSSEPDYHTNGDHNNILQHHEEELTYYDHNSTNSSSRSSTTYTPSQPTFVDPACARESDIMLSGQCVALREIKPRVVCPSGFSFTTKLVNEYAFHGRSHVYCIKYFNFMPKLTCPEDFIERNFPTVDSIKPGDAMPDQSIFDDFEGAIGGWEKSARDISNKEKPKDDSTKDGVVDGVAVTESPDDDVTNEELLRVNFFQTTLDEPEAENFNDRGARAVSPKTTGTRRLQEGDITDADFLFSAATAGFDPTGPPTCQLIVSVPAVYCNSYGKCHNKYLAKMRKKLEKIADFWGMDKQDLIPGGHF